jgi:tetratricopeptide (TPR) repeat protein
MPTDFATMFDAARADRNAGRVAEAERGYAAAADQARSQHEPLALAHALRHLSDLARERGSPADALTSAAEAVAIYRAQPGCRPLDLANALRLNALALVDAGRADESVPFWQEARHLYASVGVKAGVEEAELRLASS